MPRTYHYDRLNLLEKKTYCKSEGIHPCKINFVQSTFRTNNFTPCKTTFKKMTLSKKYNLQNPNHIFIRRGVFL